MSAQNPRMFPAAASSSTRVEKVAGSMEQSVAQLSALLRDFDSGAVECEIPEAAPETDLMPLRLHAARNLFAALRNKHSPTAAHGLRVAMGCSSWAVAMGMERTDRDELEIAALLHDIGKL